MLLALYFVFELILLVKSFPVLAAHMRSELMGMHNALWADSPEGTFVACSISDGGAGDGTSACIRFASLLVQVEPRSTVFEVILSRRVTIGWYREENGHRLGVNYDRCAMLAARLTYLVFPSSIIPRRRQRLKTGIKNRQEYK
jgi:hypothetical protein